jgi:hypothetical protein
VSRVPSHHRNRFSSEVMSSSSALDLSPRPAVVNQKKRLRWRRIWSTPFSFLANMCICIVSSKGLGNVLTSYMANPKVFFNVLADALRLASFPRHFFSCFSTFFRYRAEAGSNRTRSSTCTATRGHPDQYPEIDRERCQRSTIQRVAVRRRTYRLRVELLLNRCYPQRHQRRYRLRVMSERVRAFGADPQSARSQFGSSQPAVTECAAGDRASAVVNLQRLAHQRDGWTNSTTTTSPATAVHASVSVSVRF